VGPAVLFLAACSGGPEPQPTPGTTTSTPVTTTVAAPPSTTAPTTPAPTYTKPPARGLKRPAGLAPLSDIPCEFATSDAQFFQLAWYDAVKRVTQGDPVPASTWTALVNTLGTYRGGIGEARTKLKSDGVPTSFIVYRDLNELDTAMRSGIDVARKRDESKVTQIYYAVKTAQDHLVESCGVLEG
jgi:hypothetical protein